MIWAPAGNGTVNASNTLFYFVEFDGLSDLDMAWKSLLVAMFTLVLAWCADGQYDQWYCNEVFIDGNLLLIYPMAGHMVTQLCGSRIFPIQTKGTPHR